MNKFAIGDKVRVYYGDGSYEATVKGTTFEFVHVVTAIGDHTTAHYKQCRRLKSPRRIFLKPHNIPTEGRACYVTSEARGENTVEFVEVRKKK